MSTVWRDYTIQLDFLGPLEEESEELLNIGKVRIHITSVRISVYHKH